VKLTTKTIDGVQLSPTQKTVTKYDVKSAASDYEFEKAIAHIDLAVRAGTAA
jgi:hypothetical protein